MNSHYFPNFAQNKDEKNLLSYQTRFTTFFEQSIFPMEIFSTDGRSLASNQAWENLFSPNEFEPLHEHLYSAIDQANDGESVEVPAFWFNNKWLEAWVSPVKDESEIIYEIGIILKDVTEKMEIQQALVKSISERKAAEEKYEMISDRLSMAVKAGNIGIWEWVPDTNHLSWDETTELMFGFSRGQFPRTSEAFSEMIHPEDRDLYWLTVGHSIDEKKSYRLDLRIIKRDGAARWVQISGMALYDEKGRPYHVMGTMMDITERVESEADQKFLSQASELLNGSLDHREILKTLSDHAINYFCDGVFIDQLLPDGDIKRLMVVHPENALVKKYMLMDKLFPNRYENSPVLNTLITGKPLFVEDADIYWNKMRPELDENYYQALLQLGTKSSIRVRLKGRESILGTINFFTQKNTNKVLSKRHIWLAEELAYRASMAFENALIHLASHDAIRSRDEFLSIASHELKTPLQSLTLQNQMRKRNLDKNLLDAFKPEKISSMIDADLRHLMRINRLIDDMLDISRIRAGKLTFMKEQVEFCSFVKDVLERFRPQVESVGSYMSASYCEPIQAHIDIYRLEQVIVNLLTNAMKYGAGKPIRIEILKKQDRLQLQVHDKGPGIREEDVERIFERFERAISSSEVSGLGLGLYISRQIMEQNQGQLFVRSIVGQGSTFIMELPFDS